MPENPEIEALRADYEKQIFDLRQLLEVSKSLNSTLDYHNLIDAILVHDNGPDARAQGGPLSPRGASTRRTSASIATTRASTSITASIIRSPRTIPSRSSSRARIACYTPRGGARAHRILQGYRGAGVASAEPPRAAQSQGRRQRDHPHRRPHRGRSLRRGRARPTVLTIASLAAIAINNAFLFEMTTTDMMTKLKMKHYFYTMLLEKMEQAASEKKPPLRRHDGYRFLQEIQRYLRP